MTDIVLWRTSENAFSLKPNDSSLTFWYLVKSCY